MVNGDRNSQVFIIMRKLLLGILKVVLGWDLTFHITGAAKSSRNDWHSRQEWLVPFCTWNHCSRELLGVWVFSFLGWPLKLL